MKKLFYFAVAVAVLTGCSKDITTDVDSDSQKGNEPNYYGGVAVEATVADPSRVAVGNDGTASRMSWETGDEITLAYAGKPYVYVAQNAGRTSTFAPKDADNAITAIDAAQSVATQFGCALPLPVKKRLSIFADDTWISFVCPHLHALIRLRLTVRRKPVTIC